MPGCNSAGAAERSYPMSEARGAGQEKLPHVQGQGQGRECQAVMAQKGSRGAIPRPRSGAAARRSYLASEARSDGREEPPRTRGAVAARAQGGLEGLSHVEGQEGRR